MSSSEKSDDGFKGSKAEFVFGTPSVRELPETDKPEVALIGRSNVGKSTLLNRITERKALARTSSRPGKTLEFNFFDVAAKQPSIEPFWLVDLPGFGYAKRSKKKRAELGREIAQFLIKRPNLRIVCLLNDARRDPVDEEFLVRDLAAERGAGFLVVLTKLDKLNQKERSQRLKALTKAYSLEREDFVFTGEGLSIKPWWERVRDLLEFMR